MGRSLGFIVSLQYGQKLTTNPVINGRPALPPELHPPHFKVLWGQHYFFQATYLSWCLLNHYTVGYATANHVTLSSQYLVQTFCISFSRKTWIISDVVALYWFHMSHVWINEAGSSAIKPNIMKYLYMVCTQPLVQDLAIHMHNALKKILPKTVWPTFIPFLSTTEMTPSDSSGGRSVLIGVCVCVLLAILAIVAFVMTRWVLYFFSSIIICLHFLLYLFDQSAFHHQDSWELLSLDCLMLQVK